MGTANRNISLRALRVLCTAAERESFRETAESLFLTSSAVSHQVKQLSNSWFDSTTLVQLFEHELVTEDTYCLVYRPEDSDREEIRIFRNWVIQNLAEVR